MERRDREACQAIVRELRLGPFCHLFCHWVCVVRYHIICRWLCAPELGDRPNWGAEFYSAGQALRLLFE